MSRIAGYLKLSYRGKTRLVRLFVITGKVRTRISLQPLDYRKLAQEYQKLIDNGACANKADVAQYMGVSRAWVTKVMKKKNS